MPREATSKTSVQPLVRDYANRTLKICFALSALLSAFSLVIYLLARSIQYGSWAFSSYFATTISTFSLYPLMVSWAMVYRIYSLRFKLYEYEVFGTTGEETDVDFHPKVFRSIHTSERYCLVSIAVGLILEVYVLTLLFGRG